MLKFKSLLIIAATLYSAMLCAQVIPQVPVAYWNLDNTPTSTGEEFYSEIGNMPVSLYKNGSSVTSTFNEGKLFGKALRLHDGTPWVRTSTNPLEGKSNGSISLWFTSEQEWPSGEGYKTLFSCVGSTLTSVNFDGNHLEFRAVGGVKDLESSLPKLPIDSKNHFVLTWNNVGGETTASLYLNGTMLGSMTETFDYATLESELVWHFGTDRIDARRQPNRSHIDDIAMFDVALSASEIETIYNEGVAGNPFQSTFPLSGVVLSEESFFLKIGNSTVLTAKSIPSEDMNVNGYIWASSNPAVATVTDQGEITALSDGVATISVTYNGDATITDECELTVSMYNGPLRTLELTNPRGGVSHYPNNVDKNNPNAILTDPFTYDPNDMSNASDVVVDASGNSMFFVDRRRLAADIYYDYNYTDGSWAQANGQDTNWISVDITMPRGTVIDRFYFWGRDYANQHGSLWSTAVMLEDTLSDTRCASSDQTDVSTNNNTFKMNDSNDPGDDGLIYFNTVKFSDNNEDLDYNSASTTVVMDQNLIYTANRMFIYQTRTRCAPVGMNTAELRAAVTSAPEWPIVAVPSAVVAMDTLVKADSDFDLLALQNAYTSQVQFTDIWGYDTTGVVVWNDGGFDVSEPGVYVVSASVALPEGVVNTTETTTFDSISFEVTVDIKLESVMMLTNTKSMEVGDTTALYFRTLPRGLSTDAFVWSSTDASIATVDTTGSVVAVAAGEVMIIITSTEVATISDTCVVTVAAPASLSHSLLTQVTMYPNPTDGTFTIKGLSLASVMTIYNLAGKKITSKIVSASQLVDVSDLESGLYIVNVAGQNLKLQVK